MTGEGVCLWADPTHHSREDARRLFSLALHRHGRTTGVHACWGERGAEATTSSSSSFLPSLDVTDTLLCQMPGSPFNLHVAVTTPLVCGCLTSHDSLMTWWGLVHRSLYCTNLHTSVRGWMHQAGKPDENVCKPPQDVLSGTSRIKSLTEWFCLHRPWDCVVCVQRQMGSWRCFMFYLWS